MIGRLILFIVLLASSLSAAKAEGFRLFPEFAIVVNVAAGDTLNVRAEPTSKSADIGDLQPGQDVGILALSDDRKWAKIISGEGNGWVSARYLQVSPWPEASSGLPANLYCGGTEPFWGLSTGTGDTLVFEDPMRDEKIDLPVTWSSPSQNTGPTSYGFSANAASGVLRRAYCSDGMSDRDYGWSIDVILTRNLRPVLYSGCCSLR